MSFIEVQLGSHNLLLNKFCLPVWLLWKLMRQNEFKILYNSSCFFRSNFWLQKTVHTNSLDIFIILWVYPVTAANLLSLTFKQYFYFHSHCNVQLFLWNPSILLVFFFPFKNKDSCSNTDFLWAHFFCWGYWEQERAIKRSV